MKRIITYAQAVNESLIQSSKKDKNIIFFGEGIDDPTSFFGTTKDLGKYISSNRLIEMPLSENAITGIAVGSAIMGKKPILSFHRVEFALLAMEQIINNAAKASYISNGLHKVPLIIRLIIGRGWGQGPEHSQSLETIFSSIPGLKVLVPTFPNDAKGMMNAAIKDNNPTVIIEHRYCHFIKENVPKNYFINDIKSPKKIINGRSITIVSYSYMTLEAIEAAEELKKLNIHVELFDLRVLNPLNIESIQKSVTKTRRLLIIDLGFKKFGIGSEISSQIYEKQFSKMISPISRLGMPDHPVPSSRGYLKNLYPNSVKIIIEVCRIFNISNNKSKEIIKKITNLKSKEPIDVPFSKFKGPF